MINNGNLKLAQQISVFPPKKQLFSCLIVTKCPFEVLSRNPAMLTQSMGTFSTGIVAIILLLPFEYSLCLLLVCPTGEQTVSGLAAPYNNRSHLVVITGLKPPDLLMVCQFRESATLCAGHSPVHTLSLIMANMEKFIEALYVTSLLRFLVVENVIRFIRSSET